MLVICYDNQLRLELIYQDTNIVEHDKHIN